MHLRGVTISWVTDEVSMWSSLLSASTLASFYLSVMSRKVATLHSSLLKIRLVNVSYNFRCSWLGLWT